MNSIVELLQTVLYPFWYFLVLGLVMAGFRMLTLLLIAGGRLTRFRAVEVYWIYVLLTLFCAFTGIVFGHGNTMEISRWSLCPLLAGLIGIYLGYDKGLAVSDEELEDIENEADEMDQHSQ